jgi:hypothetical protein
VTSELSRQLRGATRISSIARATIDRHESDARGELHQNEFIIQFQASENNFQN